MPTYPNFNPALPNGGPPDNQGGAAVLQSVRDNQMAIMDGLVFSGISPWKVSWKEQNADGSPATDPTLPYQYMGVAVSDANHKWKAVNTYGAGNRLDSIVYYRSYDAGATWNLIKTTTFNYDGSGNCTSAGDS
jgi:hypothetical protein